MNYQLLKTVSQVGTYSGSIVSWLLTWINLHYKTSQEPPDSGHQKILTNAGKVSRILLVLLALTVVSAIVQNWADSHLKKEAEERGTSAIQKALAGQHQRYLSDLKEQFEGKNGVLPKLGEQTEELKTAESRIMGLSTEAINQVTGSRSYAYLAYIPNQNFLAFVHVGKYPLYGVSARIVDLDRAAQSQDVLGRTIDIGEMIHGHAYTEPVPPNFAAHLDRFNANVFFTARNGDWIEELREVRVKDGWARAVRVTGQFTSLKKEELLCETIDPGFPRNAQGGIDEFRPTDRPKPVPRCL